MTTPATDATPAIAAALLRQGRVIHLASCCCTLAAMIGALVARPHMLAFALLVCAILLGAVQIYLAIRVGFDAALFKSLARNAIELSSLDQAMLALGLLPQRKAGRPLPARIAGARLLFHLQIAVTLGQFAAILAALVATRWG
jgi:hypothetical protein